MDAINMLEAKTQLSKLVDAVENGREDEIVIARNGRPVARLVPIAHARSVRLGVAKGLFQVPDDIDTHNAEVAALLAAEPRP